MTADRAITYILDKGLGGIAGLASANDLASEYLSDAAYSSNDERVGALINWETSKNFTTGFITGLGGLLTLPVTIPSALGASWVLQARMSGAIARIYGHELADDRVRTMILLSIAGDAAMQVVKSSGIRLGTQLTRRTISRIPGRTLVEINRRVGFRLLTKAGERGIVNFTKAVPVVGGVVGGAFDAVTCRAVGQASKRLFRRERG